MKNYLGVFKHAISTGPLGIYPQFPGKIMFILQFISSKADFLCYTSKRPLIIKVFFCLSKSENTSFPPCNYGSQFGIGLKALAQKPGECEFQFHFSHEASSMTLGQSKAMFKHFQNLAKKTAGKNCRDLCHQKSMPTQKHQKNKTMQKL